MARSMSISFRGGRSTYPIQRGATIRRALAACVVIVLSAAVASASKAPSPAPGTARSNFEDAPEPFVPKNPQSGSERDHADAVALFAAARMHEHDGEYAGALRCYQRALRCDPQSTAIAEAIVPLAVRLKRYPEAIRYAMKAAEVSDADPRLLRGLAADLAQQGQWLQAAVLYERVVKAARRKTQTADDIVIHMQLGRLYGVAEKYAKAADNFAKVLYAVDHPGEFGMDDAQVKILLGKPGPTYQLIGECFLEAQRPHEALDAFRKAEQALPDESLRQFNLARVYLQTGKPDEALATLQSALAAHLTEQGIAPYETLAAVLEKLGKKEQLCSQLEALRAADSADLALGYFLADQYRAAGQSEKAEKLYIELIGHKPTVTGYRNLVDIYRKAKRFDALLELLGSAIEKTSVLDVLGSESQIISNDPEAMQRLVDEARARLKADAKSCGYGMRLAVALLAIEAKQYDTAGQFFDLALSERPKQSAEVLMVWGVGLLTGNRAAEAAKVFQRGIDEKVLPDDNPAFYFYLSGALALDKRPDEALAAAQLAAERKKNSSRFRSRTAWVLYVAKRYDEAEKAYQQLIEQFDADRDTAETREVLRDARLALSNIAVNRGDIAQAEEWLQQVLDEFPDDQEGLNDLGYLWADENKNLERAERMIRRALEVEPDNMAYRDSLGWVLYRLGRTSQAVVELEKAAGGEKPDGVVLDHLGDAYQALDRREQAEQMWRKAAEVLRAEKETAKAEAIEKKLTNR